jgi:hypothetical protein
MNEPVAAVRRSKSAGRKRATKRSGGRTRRAAPARTRTSGRKASGLLRRGKHLVDEAQGWIGEARGMVPRIAERVHLPSGRRIESFAEHNPVLLGAVGLGIGVIIGALLPRDALHTGMQGMGLSAAAPSPRPRRTSKARARK